jgi:hypothetical protein
MPRRLQALFTVSSILMVAGAGALAQQPQSHYTPSGGGAVTNPASAPMLQSTSGGTFLQTAYFVRITYTSRSGESVPSMESSLKVGAGSLLVVVSPPAATNATGWNVYVSTSSGTEARQNGSTPLPIGTIWIEPASDSTTALQLETSSGTTTVLDVDTSNQRVGVGTTAPQSNLHVSGASPTFLLRSTGTALRGMWETVDDTNGVISFNSSQSSSYNYPITFQMGNGEVVRIDGHGNLGVGTASPALQLQVAKAMGAGVYPVPVISGTAYFDASQGNTQKLTLTGNTTSTLSNPSGSAGEVLNFIICQPVSGGPWSFAWPSNVQSPPAINPAAGACTYHATVFDGTNAVPLNRDSSGNLIATGITANGPNQSITITPSGTGVVSLAGPASIGSSAQLTVNSSGMVTKYNGTSTANSGVPAEVGSVTDGPKSTGGSTVTILASTSASDSIYLIDFYAEQTNAGSGGTCATNATVPLNLRWTGPASQTQNSTPVTLTLTPALAGNNAVQTMVVRAKASTVLTLVEGTFTNGNCTTQPKYSVWATATAM